MEHKNSWVDELMVEWDLEMERLKVKRLLNEDVENFVIYHSTMNKKLAGNKKGTREWIEITEKYRFILQLMDDPTYRTSENWDYQIFKVGLGLTTWAFLKTMVTQLYSLYKEF